MTKAITLFKYKKYKKSIIIELNFINRLKLEYSLLLKLHIPVFGLFSFLIMLITI